MIKRVLCAVLGHRWKHVPGTRPGSAVKCEHCGKVVVQGDWR